MQTSHSAPHLLVLGFEQFDAGQQLSTGGKGSTLARLYQAGYPVPDGFVILPDAFDGNELKEESWGQVQKQLNCLRQNQDGIAFAVRSSALSEDSAQASFAGEFETVLGARSDAEIQSAIDSVRRSRLSRRVQAYSQAKGMESEHETAVIIQQMVPAEISGVLFTADPVTGSQTRMTGNFVHGLANSLFPGR